MMTPQLVAEFACTWVLVHVPRRSRKGRYASLFRATAIITVQRPFVLVTRRETSPLFWCTSTRTPEQRERHVHLPSCLHSHRGSMCVGSVPGGGQRETFLWCAAALSAWPKLQHETKPNKAPKPARDSRPRNTNIPPFPSIPAPFIHLPIITILHHLQPAIMTLALARC